jgi:hypothetical protein
LAKIKVISDTHLDIFNIINKIDNIDNIIYNDFEEFMSLYCLLFDDNQIGIDIYKEIFEIIFINIDINNMILLWPKYAKENTNRWIQILLSLSKL